LRPRILPFLFLLTALPALAAAPKYHLVLEANPGAPFPFLSKFGTFDIDVYPSGVRADTIWLDGFSRNGSKTVTVMNPLGRMYTDVPLTEVSAILTKMSASMQYRNAVPSMLAPARGTFRGMDSTRYRLQYGPQAWIDIWTIQSIADNAQLRALVDQFVGGISPPAATLLRNVRGVPVYVELNFSHYRKLPLLKMKTLTFDDSHAESDLSTGALYFKAPLLDALWK
jgi:hypothetical protein